MEHPGIRDRLEFIKKACGTRVIAISGRPAREVGRMLGIQTVTEIWGVTAWSDFIAMDFSSVYNWMCQQMPWKLSWEANKLCGA